ncbi:hypothetical protein PR003_g16230 [Phytophthora rubi]|uniref:Uncharacterized protein n=1 Tax=Phytophthora rubi TaxID=129364 RepID=A0A6A3PBA5_9STRA|nr:hypothetical protein PR002_g160 [Phytophthora rubi]KAE9049986.1 hypothetical protein PR001_g2804 [Phytophthora rubi]KAE9326513.1 hypothetical protein PR003_g16230 [Phytophthora rubi]
MTILRPGSSVLKPGVRERQRELETVITKYELLLAIGRTKNPDFESIDQQQVIFRLAECRLALARVQRTAWQIDQNGQTPIQPSGDNEDDEAVDAVETMQTTLHDMLEKTRRLYQLPEVVRSIVAVQGEVQVLIETGELFTFCGNHANAMSAYAEAIRLCYNIEDEATEAILTSKLRKLQRHADAAARVEALVVERASDGDNNGESERSKLKAAFEKVADDDGFLVKNQLQAFSGELGMHEALTNSEIDDMWRQMQQNDKSAHTRDDAQRPASNAISFDTFWRWWVSDAVYDYMMKHALI